MNTDSVGSSRRPHFQGNGVRHATIGNHRFHLRLSDGKHHHLWIDGRQPPLILDQTAADFVSNLIDAMWLYQRGEGDESAQVIDYVVSTMHRKYGRRGRKVTPERIRTDLDRLFGTLMAMAEGKCPSDIGLRPREIRYDQWTAPARMDLAVTYRCNLSCGKCYLPDNPAGEEMGLADWLKVYEILWKLGVPQVVFTGGEPTIREDIVQLVDEAEEFVTGLVTNGTRLVDLAEPLCNASLDYAQVTIESDDPKVHDEMTQTPGSHSETVAGIKKALEVGLQTVTNTTLTRANGADFLRTFSWLSEDLGIRHIACNTLICSGKGSGYRSENGLSEQELKPILQEVCELAAKNGIDFQWYSPTCYNAGINPLELGLGIKSCSAAAHNMTIQPDGTVLPCQSWPESVGNILTDDWSRIWKHPTCLALRGHKMAPAECGSCGYLGTCGGGCPLDKTPRERS